MTQASPTAEPALETLQAPRLSAGLTFIMAAACGLIAANLYYAQPLAGPIADAIGLPLHASGLIVTLTQVGYGLGLFFLVPLGDLVENRKLILVMIGAVTAALIAACLATTPLPFLAASLSIGLGAVAVQMIVPFAAGLAPEQSRGKVVGNVMSGLMVGIMMARPVSSLVARLGSWHTIFFLSAAVMVALGVVLAMTLPERRPQAKLGYLALIGSMGRLFVTQTVLQRRAAYQAFQFAAFSLFWTVTPLYLASPAFGLTQTGIALFALAGVAGAIASPIAGRLADRGLSGPATAFGLSSVLTAFVVTLMSPEGSWIALSLLTFAAILLDFGVTTTLVTGQRAIFGLGAELRSRLNGLFMAIFFTGGAIGSAIGAYSYAQGGWTAAAILGGALPLAALLLFLTEARRA
ncbi:MFS transporter [Rhizobium sp. AG855]|uniref:MFS transporter n=1 Tax=Rhizobium sp. AG855 TaxID=2183898 RepID=UPI000E74BEC6|nr:MFS transporter [Rhizobium sp. AG855]RKE86571.1 putative MFS family arabinose efflux permease [Rhizobium sp. AG855]